MGLEGGCSTAVSTPKMLAGGYSVFLYFVQAEFKKLKAASVIDSKAAPCSRDIGPINEHVHVASTCASYSAMLLCAGCGVIMHYMM